MTIHYYCTGCATITEHVNGRCAECHRTNEEVKKQEQRKGQS